MQSSGQSHTPPAPELLAPAGDWESLKAAVANGADAIYFGLRRFSARGRAANFAAEELPEVFEYLRDRNTKGYVAVNTLIFPEELAEAAKLVEAVAGAGADAIIVQDVGLLRLVRRMAPTLPVHASTQMTQTHAEGLHLLEDWGVSRVILARELSLPQIRTIRQSCAIELEVFVHGALCISYSGQCLASQTLFARSGNRGQCAQACRLPYELVVDGAPQGAMPLPVRGEGHEDAPHSPPAATAGNLRRVVTLHPADGTCSSAEDRVGAWHPSGARYPLSPRDLCALDLIGELVEAGVTGFKIEGRMKNADYVAAATRAYRDATDAAVAGGVAARRGEAELRMAQSFSRGFTEGFLGGVDHQKLVDGRSPKSRGVRVGTVAGPGEGGILVTLEGGAEIRPGDGLVFGGNGIEDDEQGGRVYTVRPVRIAARPSADAGSWHGRAGAKRGEPGLAGGRTVEIAFGTGAVDMAAVALGSDVWKSDDPQTRREIRHSYSRDVIWRKRKINLKVSAAAGGALRIAAQDDLGLSAVAEWPGPLEASTRQAISEESIREQFSRLGNTPYELGAVELAGPDGPAESVAVMAPKSVLNALRREVVEKLRKARSEGARHKIVEPDAIKIAIASWSTAGSTQVPPPQSPGKTGIQIIPPLKRGPVTQLCVLVHTLPQMEAVIRFHADGGRGPVAMAYCDMPDDSARREVMDLARAAGMAVGGATTVVLMPGEEKRLERLLDTKPDAVLVRNLAALRMLRRLAPAAGPGAAPAVTLVADYHLNAANALSARAILEAGADRVTACMDLPPDQLAAMIAPLPAGAVELAAWLHVPMFHTAHCLWAANLGDGHDCRDCGRPCRQHRLGLRHRAGEEHPVLVDESGRNTVFQFRAKSLAPGAALSAGAGWLRVELLEESAEATQAALDQAATQLAGR